MVAAIKVEDVDDSYPMVLAVGVMVGSLFFPSSHLAPLAEDIMAGKTTTWLDC